MRLFLHFLSAVEKDVALALMRRCFNVLCVLGMSLKKRRHIDVHMTLFKRFFSWWEYHGKRRYINVHMTLFSRFSTAGNVMGNDVALTLGVCWERYVYGKQRRCIDVGTPLL